MKAARGRSPGKLCKQHTSCPMSDHLATTQPRVEADRKALNWETGSCPCFAQRDLLPLQQYKEQGSRALLTRES